MRDVFYLRRSKLSPVNVCMVSGELDSLSTGVCVSQTDEHTDVRVQHERHERKQKIFR